MSTSSRPAETRGGCPMALRASRLVIVALPRFSLELSFQQVNGLLGVSEDRLVVSGYASRRGVAGDSGGHLFSPKGKLLRSFGPLPEVADQEMLRYWGTGALSLTRGGLVLYLPKSPYVIHGYSLESRQHLQVTPRATGTATKAAPFVFLKSLSRTVVQASPDSVDATVQVIEVRPGLFLSERARAVSGELRQEWSWCWLTSTSFTVRSSLAGPLPIGARTP